MPTEQPHAAFARNISQLDIVVIDDAKPMQTILRSMLHSFRVSRVRVFDGAHAAMQSMLVDPPNLLIVDWRMTPIDGIQMIKALRIARMGALALVPAIVVTADPTRRLVEASVRVSAHGVLAKPLAPATLLKRIEAIVADARPFVLNEETGTWALSGTDAFLEAQRSRWLQLHVARAGYSEMAESTQKRAKKTAPKEALDATAAATPLVKAKPAPKVKPREFVPEKVTGFAARRIDAAKFVPETAKAGQGDDKAA